jgi:hypothetical protein
MQSSLTQTNQSPVFPGRFTLINKLKAIEQSCKVCTDLANTPHPTSLRELHEICEATRLAVKAPGDLVTYAKPSMLSQETIKVLSKAEQLASKLSIKAIELQEKFNLALLPGRESLNGILRALQTHERSLLRFMSSEYRQAKAKFFGFVNDPKALPRGSWSKSVSELVQYIDAKDAFAANQEYRDRFAALFSGVDTDWSRLRRLLSWVGEVGRTISNRALLSILMSRDERMIFALGSEHQRLMAGTAGFVSSAAEALRKLRLLNDWITTLQACELPTGIERWLLDADTLDRTRVLSKIADAIRPHTASMHEDLRQIQKFGEYDEQRVFDSGLLDVPLQKLDERLSTWLDNLAESPRVCRRLQFLRGWSHENNQQIFPGSPGTGGAAGIWTAGRV